jgi:outer membrane protein
MSSLSAQAPARVRISLSEAVAQATGNTPSVEIASLQVQAASARVREARAALLPTLVGSAGWLDRSFNKNSFGIEFPTAPGQAPLPDRIGPFSLYDARFGVRQTLLDLSALQRVQATRSAVVGTEAQRSVTSESSAQRAALAYLRGVRAAATLSARQADVELASELLSLAETELQAGVGTAIDVTRAKTQKVAADGRVLLARNQLQQASIDLARALGQDASTEYTFADTLSAGFGASSAPTDVGQATQLALSRRPELRAESAHEDAARMTRRSIEMEWVPRLDLAGDYGGNGTTSANFIGTGQIGLQVTWPVLQGFGREARLAEQSAVVRESQVRARDLTQQVSADVRASLLDLQNGQEQQAVAAEQLNLAEEELSQSRERFRNGVAGNIEVINAQSSLIRARDADIDARYAAAVARINLARAAGVASTLH